MFNQHWNVVGNWLVKVDGSTFGSGASGDGLSGGSSGDFHLAPVSRVPGAGDVAIFDGISAGDFGLTFDIPLANCSVGGHYLPEGWANAGLTQGRINRVEVKSKWGYNPASGFQESRGDVVGMKLGCNGLERGNLILINADTGLKYAGSSAGVTFGDLGTNFSPAGLKITARTFTNETPNRNLVSLFQPDILISNLASQKQMYTSEGGTYESVYCDWQPVQNGAGSSNLDAASSRITIKAPNEAVPAAKRPSINTSLYIGTVGGLGEVADEDGDAFRPLAHEGINIETGGTIPRVDMDSARRIPTTLRAEEFTTVNSYPERKTQGSYDSFTLTNPISGSTCTVGTLNMRVADDIDSDRTIIPFYHNGITAESVVGANNIVGVDQYVPFTSFAAVPRTFVVNNLVIEGGRFVLGSRKGYELNGSSQIADCNIGESGTTFPVIIENGVLGDNAIVDFEHVNNSTYKGAKIGKGTSHPSQDEGLQSTGQRGKIYFPVEMKIVADYPASEAGITVGKLFDGVAVSLAGRRKG